MKERNLSQYFPLAILCVIALGTGLGVNALAEETRTTAAAVAEMFLQSHESAIVLLLALPPSWGDGEAEGLCARGGFEVSFSWADGKLRQAVIKSKNGNTCRIRIDWAVFLSPGEAGGQTLKPKDGVVAFDTEPGSVYFLSIEKKLLN